MFKNSCVFLCPHTEACIGLVPNLDLRPYKIAEFGSVIPHRASLSVVGLSDPEGSRGSLQGLQFKDDVCLLHTVILLQFHRMRWDQNLISIC